MNLLKNTLTVDPNATLVVWGHFLFRVLAGMMIFNFHGMHKLKGWIAYVRHGTPWQLADEVAGMHLPAPVVLAFAATMVQLVCPVFVVFGLFTRINALLLVGVLGVAIFQNLRAGRDPQLAILYTLVVIALAFIGGGKCSLDARLVAMLAK